MTPTQTKQLSTTRGVSCNIYLKFPLVYTRYMLVICHQQPGLQLQHSCGLAESSRRPLPLHPCTSCGSSVSQPPRDQQHEAVACQSSTAKCWPHIHGCLCAIPGEVYQHSQIQSPDPVELHICEEWWKLGCHPGSMERVEPDREHPQPCQHRE